MRLAVIDVGSNSVRLMMWQDGKTLYKRLNTTRLGENTAATRTLTRGAIDRTARAIANFREEALADGAESVHAFATEAVRSAKNGADFVEAVRALCPVEVEILSGEQEAAYGVAGALKGEDGAVIDVGGASSEVILSVNGKAEFSYSLPFGSVRLFDLAGRSHKDIEKVIDGAVSKIAYPDARGEKVCAIGGTATTVASVFHGLEKYDPAIVEGTVINTEWIGDMSRRICGMPVEEVKKIAGMEPRRADVIGGGALLLYKLGKAIGAENITVSESDNLEGYVLLRLINNNK